MRRRKATEMTTTADGARSALSAELDVALKATGFVACEFPPDEDPCECCKKTGVQLYWRSCDPFSQDGRYHCAQCVIDEHVANEETDAFDWMHEASNV